MLKAGIDQNVSLIMSRTSESMDPQAQAFLDAIASTNAPGWETLHPEESRKRFAEMHSLFGEGPKLASVKQLRTQRGVDLRCYRPSHEDHLPCVVFYHGGGWVIGDLETHDTLCRILCAQAGVLVISVAYRRAPEHPYPIPLDDCCDALTYCVEHASELGLDLGRLAVAGDSAGGNLAAAAALRMQKNQQVTLHSQWLLYPVTQASFDTTSYRRYASGFGLSLATMQWFWDQYVPDAEVRLKAEVSPLNASRVDGLPKAFLYLAERDVLYAEGLAYATKLQQGGIEVQTRVYPGMLHGFVHFSGFFDIGRQALNEWCLDLKKAFQTT